MPDFSNLKKFEVKRDQTVVYKINEIDFYNHKTPELHVLPATSKNPPYFNAILKRQARKLRQVQTGNIDVEFLKANREENKQLYPVFIIKNWSNVFDAQGEEVPFSEENCKDFIANLDDWIFDNLSAFCENSQNFVGAANLDLEELGNG